MDTTGEGGSYLIPGENPETVLLDENLLKESIENPMYLRPHSKNILRKSIEEDTAFLSSHLVMDYSLLVGVDETNHELVVGQYNQKLLEYSVQLKTNRDRCRSVQQKTNHKLVVGQYK